MLLRNQPPPLETIYEESSSSIECTGDISRRRKHPSYGNEAFNGLISARLIPSVDTQRQRTTNTRKKPPIEVQLRDGSKHFIHPSTNTPMMMNRRFPLTSNRDHLSSTIPTIDYRQIFNKRFKKRNFQSKPPLVVSVITADDLHRAGIASSMSSSSEDSDTTTIAQSLSKSSIDTITALKGIRQDSLERSSNGSIPSLQTIVSDVTASSRSPLVSVSQQSLQFSNQSSHRLSSTSSQTSFLSANEVFVSLYPKVNDKPLKPVLTNSENKKNLLLNSSYPNTIVSSKLFPDQTYTNKNSNNAKLLQSGENKSAFRPFNKTVRFDEESLSLSSKSQSTSNPNPKDSTQIPKKLSSYVQYSDHKYPPTSLSNLLQTSYQLPPRKIKINETNRSYHPIALKQNLPQNLVSMKFPIEKNILNPQKQSMRLLMPTMNSNINNSFTLPNLFSVSEKPNRRVLPPKVNPPTKWLNESLNSVQEISRLSTKYSSASLNTKLPLGIPTQIQRPTITRNLALENRLLNAGLPPETVALYESILNLAEGPSRVVPPSLKTVDPYKKMPFM